MDIVLNHPYYNATYDFLLKARKTQKQYYSLFPSNYIEKFHTVLHFIVTSWLIYLQWYTLYSFVSLFYLLALSTHLGYMYNQAGNDMKYVHDKFARLILCFGMIMYGYYYEYIFYYNLKCLFIIISSVFIYIIKDFQNNYEILYSEDKKND